MDIVWKQYGTKLKILWKFNFHTNCNFHTIYGYSMETVWNEVENIMEIQFSYKLQFPYYGYSSGNSIIWNEVENIMEIQFSYKS